MDGTAEHPESDPHDGRSAYRGMQASTLTGGQADKFSAWGANARMSLFLAPNDLKPLPRICKPGNGHGAVVKLPLAGAAVATCSMSKARRLDRVSVRVLL